MKHLGGALAVLLLSMAAWAQWDQPTLEDYQSHYTVIPVPPGNRNELMPEPGEGTKKFLAREKMASEIAAIQKKYNRTVDKLTQRDEKDEGQIIRMINRIAPIYGVAPIHVLGALIGEHTFNVDLADTIIQDGALHALSWWRGLWGGGDLKVADLVKTPEVQQQCEELKPGSRYEYWTCIDYVWNRDFRGQYKYGRRWDDRGLIMAFFNPTGVGRTYGLGQMSPLRVLMTTDIVHNYSPNMPSLDVTDAKDVYEAVLDPETTIHYLAANIRVAIDYYKEIAGFDISDNPGITATLYNLGKEKARAMKLYRENLKSLRSGGELIYPEENYYGWWINYKREDLEKMLAKYPAD